MTVSGGRGRKGRCSAYMRVMSTAQGSESASLAMSDCWGQSRATTAVEEGALAASLP